MCSSTFTKHCKPVSPSYVRKWWHAWPKLKVPFPHPSHTVNGSMYLVVLYWVLIDTGMHHCHHHVTCQGHKLSHIKAEAFAYCTESKASGVHIRVPWYNKQYSLNCTILEWALIYPMLPQLKNVHLHRYYSLLSVLYFTRYCTWRYLGGAAPTSYTSMCTRCVQWLCGWLYPCKLLLRCWTVSFVNASTRLIFPFNILPISSWVTHS